MGWADSVVTKTGIYLLNESLAGYALTIRHGAGGAGLLDPAELEDAAALSDPKQTFSICGVENVEGGKRVRIQITNRDVEEAYILHQIGVFARLDYQEEDSLLFLMQDSRGVQIPSREENPEFLLEIYAILAINNAADIRVNIDASTVVSEGFLRETLETHNMDEGAHPGLREEVEQVRETAQAAREAVKELAEGGLPLLVIGETEPEKGAVFWFDTRARRPEIIELQLGGEGDETPVTAEIDGRAHPVTNAAPTGAEEDEIYEIEITD